MFAKKIRKIKRQINRRKPLIAAHIAVLFAAGISYAGYMHDRRLIVDPQSYQPLLHLIAEAESSNNYNAYFGNPDNVAIDFTRMSVQEVQQWQADYLKQGSPSDAVGRYQIISPTLNELINKLNIDTSRAFDKELQDTLAIALLERRGSTKYANKELTSHGFAANLAKEWAALPKTIGSDPDASYYDGDGLNKSRVSIPEVLSAIEPIRAK